jgi:hypothetical protein
VRLARCVSLHAGVPTKQAAGDDGGGDEEHERGRETAAPAPTTTRRYGCLSSNDDVRLRTSRTPGVYICASRFCNMHDDEVHFSMYLVGLPLIEAC